MRHYKKYSHASRLRHGFSLLEITLAIGISGILMGSIWQLMGITAQQREASTLASQAYAVAQAGQSYLNANTTTLLALPGLAAINSVVRVKLTAADTGSTTTNVQDSGYLPASFVNANSYGQSYALYAQRQEGGAAGPDASDKLIGLVLTTGGTVIGDQLGARTASAMGAAGGFLYQDSNPTLPTAATAALGTAGGWTLNLGGTGWTSAVGTTATAGHLAVLTTFLAGSSGMGSGGGASSIDALSDGITNYTSSYNVFLGDSAGTNTTSSGTGNVALGYQALNNNTTGSSITAIGFGAHRYMTTGTENVAIGHNALSGYGGAGTTNQSIGIGEGAGSTATGNNVVAIGYAAASGSGGSIGNSSVAIGSQAMRYSGASGSVAIGDSAMAGGSYNQSIAIGYIAMAGGGNGMYNIGVGGTVGSGDGLLHNLTAGAANIGIGASTLGSLTSGNYNIALGHVAGSNITTGSNNIVIGYNTTAPVGAGSNQLNIGNTLFGDLLNQRVGINTSTPADTLDVNGQSYLRGAILTGNGGLDAKIELGELGSGGRHAYIDFNADDNWADYSMRLIRFAWYNGEGMLTHRGAGALTIQTENLAPIRFYTNATERMYIDAGGNIGIHTNSPQTTLDINGYMRLTPQGSAPVACGASNTGAVALTSNSTLCACKGSSSTWVRTSDGVTGCVW